MRTWIDQLAEHGRGMPVADDLAHLLHARAQFVECVRRIDAMIARQVVRRLEARLDEDGGKRRKRQDAYENALPP